MPLQLKDQENIYKLRNEDNKGVMEIMELTGHAFETVVKYSQKVEEPKHPKKFLKIKPFAELIDALLEGEPNISINKMFEYLVSQGYEGKKTILLVYLKTKKENQVTSLNRKSLNPNLSKITRKYTKRATKEFIKVKAYKVLRDNMLFESEGGALNHIEELDMKERIAQWTEANYHEGMSKEEITELLFKSALGVI